MNPASRRSYCRVFLSAFTGAALVGIAVIAAATAAAQTRHRHEPREAEPAGPPPVAIDKRDSLVALPGAFNGRPYWLVLAQCGGLYFKLNVLYTSDAVQARVVKPDPAANAEYTRKLNEAIRTASAYFSGAEHFLMDERGIERTDAVLIYDAYSRAAGDRVKTIDAALAAAKACPALYQVCHESHAKECGEPLPPVS